MKTKPSNIGQIFSSCCDSRMLIPTLLWCVCFAWLFVLLFLNITISHGSFAGVLFLCLAMVLIIICYSIMNGIVLSMILGAWRDPLVVRSVNNGAEIHVDGYTYFLPKDSIKKVEKYYIGRKLYTLAFSLRTDLLDEKMQGIVNNHRQRTGYDLTIGYPYLEIKQSVNHVLDVLGHKTDELQLSNERVPYGMKKPRPVYLIAGMIMNLVVLYMLFTRGV